MISFVLFLLVILLAYLFYQQYYVQKEGLGTQNKLPAYFSPFTLNNIPLKMTYWANRLNGDSTTGNIDPYTVANDLKTTARTLNIVLYGDENGVNQKFVGMMSSIPFTINNLPIKMLTWANRLNGDPTGGTIDPQSIAHEIQYCSFLLNQALNGGDIQNINPISTPETTIPSVEIEVEEEVEVEEEKTQITPYHTTTTYENKTTQPMTTPIPEITRYNSVTTYDNKTTQPMTTPIPNVTPYYSVTVNENTTPETTLPITAYKNVTTKVTSKSDSTTPYTYSTASIVTPYKTIPSEI